MLCFSTVRKITKICLLAVFISVWAGVFAWASEDDCLSKPCGFRDIPGVTAEDIAAVEALQKRYGKFIYGMSMTTEAFSREDGSIGGFSALFCDWMSEMFGIKFEPRIYEWSGLLSGLRSGEIDFSGELTLTPERLERYVMTRPFSQRAIKAFRIRGSPDLEEIARARPLRYAFLGDATMSDITISSSEFEIEPIFVGTRGEGIAKLRSGEADAYVGEGHVVGMLGDDIYGEDIFPVAYSPISFSTAQKELEPIIRVFDRYLELGASPLIAGMYKRGRDDFLRDKLQRQLTPEEKAYVAAHSSGESPIPVMLESFSYPSSFYNSREKEWQGVAVDVLKKIGSISGLDFQPGNSSGDAWSVILAKLENGEGAIITELIYSNDRKGKFLWADEPYSIDYYALLSMIDHDDIDINQILNFRVGLIKRSAYADAFWEWFPDHKGTVEYATIKDAFAALEKGEIDLLMASRNLLLSATNYYEKPWFKVNMMFNRKYESIFGFNKGEHLLRSIVSKAQRLVDNKTITDRWSRRVFDYRRKMLREQIPYLIGLAALLFCLLLMLLAFLAKNAQMKKKLEITVRERTAELEIQTENARIASRAKGDFLSRMSHEIRTPLNAIIGMAHVARNAAAVSPEKTAASVGEIIAASSHLMDILNDILDMSKIEAGKLSLADEPFSMLIAMKDVENIVLQRCNEKNVLFESNADAIGDVVVLGDKLRLRQILINLLGNAIKFTDSGGKVEFAVEKTEEDEDNLTLRYSVSDSGIGMSDEHIARLFAAFEQADGSIASRFGGTGLGLAISQNLVEQMGGRIKVSSSLGEGTSFSFEIHFKKGSGADISRAMERSHELTGKLDLSGKRLLLVDDIAINRLIIKELLDGSGAVIDEAEDGEAAVRMFEESPPGYYDLILMDIQMPLMDGYGATLAIREMERADAGTVQIVAMTANAYREDIERAISTGMNAHLSKPIDVDSLMRTLAENI